MSNEAEALVLWCARGFAGAPPGWLAAEIVTLQRRTRRGDVAASERTVRYAAHDDRTHPVLRKFCAAVLAEARRLRVGDCPTPAIAGCLTTGPDARNYAIAGSAPAGGHLASCTGA